MASDLESVDRFQCLGWFVSNRGLRSIRSKCEWRVLWDCPIEHLFIKVLYCDSDVANAVRNMGSREQGLVRKQILQCLWDIRTIAYSPHEQDRAMHI